MHFFFTYEAKEFTTPNTVRAPQLFDDNGNELDWVGGLTPELRENYGPVANPFDEDLFFAKIDWEISDVDRLELSGKSRQERQQAGAAGVIAESAASTYVNDDERWRCAGSTPASVTSTRRRSPTRTPKTRRRRRATCRAGSSWPWARRATASIRSCRSTASIRAATSSRRRAAIPSRTT